MDCEDLHRLLSARVLAELTPEEQAAVAAHVGECEACRERWGLDHQSQALHKAARSLLSDTDLRDAVMAQLGERQRGAAVSPPQHERIGGFELLGRLGEGGMGTVYKARQLSMDRPVALKVLPKRLAENAGFVERFIREARAAAKLHHPHIVQAHDVGFADGRYYFAMELVDGEGLDAVVRREGPLEQGRALEIARQVCSALAAAHKAGIVHRDIKPANLMLDAEGLARVTDFGLARHLEGQTVITADGHALGTPAYMAPEVASGQGAGPRADLYSLGATLFHLLAGRPPFVGKSPTEVLMKLATQDPPSTADLAPHVDRRLCQIVDRLLRKNPDERYPSAQALLDELEALSRSRLAPPSDTSTLELSRAARLRRARRTRAILLVTGCAAVVATAGAVFWAAARRSAQRVGTTKEALPVISGAEGWVELFDGKSLRGWAIVGEGQFANHGAVHVDSGRLVLERGGVWTGVRWQGDLPQDDYELEIEAVRLLGEGDLCSFCFPVGRSACALKIGMRGNRAWLSSMPESTRTVEGLQKGRWHRVRVRVTRQTIAAWFDGWQLFDVRRVTDQPPVPYYLDPLGRFGVGAYQTRTALRRVRVRQIEGEVDHPAPATAQEAGLEGLPFRKWGEETLDRLEKDLRVGGTDLYAEWRDAGGGQGSRSGRFAPLLPSTFQLGALAAAAKVDPMRYRGPLTRFADALDSYQVARDEVVGYADEAGGAGRSYSANARLLNELIETYEATGQARYLDRAAAVLDFLLSGDKTGPGGIPHREEKPGGPQAYATAQAALGALRLYRITNDARLLRMAQRWHAWLTSEEVGLQDPRDGLYRPGAKLVGGHWELEGVKRGAASASVLRLNALLYTITKDEKCLADARRIAEAAIVRWVQPSGAVVDMGLPNTWHGSDLCLALLDLYEVDRNPRWLATVRRVLRFVHDHCRDANGRYGQYWNGEPDDREPKRHYLGEIAGAARAFWRAAAFEKP